MNNLRKAQISARIAAELAKGKDIKQAIDAVLGAGRFDQIASEVYDQLRSTSAPK